MSTLSTKLSTDFVEMYFYQNGLTVFLFYPLKESLLVHQTFEIPFPL